MSVTASVVRGTSPSFAFQHNPHGSRKLTSGLPRLAPPGLSYKRAPVGPLALQLPHRANVADAALARHQAHATDQQQALWREVQNSVYNELPDAPAAADSDSWLQSKEHPSVDRLRHAIETITSLPLVAFQVGCLYGGFGLGVAAGLFGLGRAPMLAAYMAARQVQHLAHTPRVMCATAEFKPEPNTAFTGLFKSGGPVIVSWVSGRCGPYIRLDFFAEGAPPRVLRSNQHWNQAVLQPLAETQADGQRAGAPHAPDAMNLKLREWRYWEPNEDWRQAVHDRFQAGEVLYQVVDNEPDTGKEVTLGELRLTSQFVASAFGDLHMQ